ncbi:integrins alpha chain, putative [Trichomonas vaginalis G3]|uniref:Integrins alpha chain, putative n=1 Tax=Trichomonas vaginalis (strain ATCC PRA-98 / G3) TaxID=412133 RepID=A2F7B4_TRIV3|nr:rhamnogalacturonan lyase (eurofung) family [Trichomonas vaginalis G3]EAX99182.1 integrins alpha chain, putative [Trichomonas vaginalis G3]KAI5487980.1 rhamnogalacturonan lyase (eurofung) family [Trichomonas vaginalis G3]|eukprot:XP_001312112.1 integrins alpha chain [Trichomonas vaginalis G3]
MYNAATNTSVNPDPASTMFPSNNIYWDGTLNPACYNQKVLTKWNPVNGRGDRLFTAYRAFFDAYGGWPQEDESGKYPLFHGDIIGDWREEFIMTLPGFDTLIIFTSSMDTDIKLTSLWHDPGMRASMTLNGYKQSHMPLEYLGTETNTTEHRQNLKKYHLLRVVPDTPAPTPLPRTPIETPTATPTMPPANNSDSTNNSSIKSDESNKKKVNVAAIVVPIIFVAAALVCGFFLYRYIKAKRTSDNITEVALIV